MHQLTNPKRKSLQFIASAKWRLAAESQCFTRSWRHALMSCRPQNEKNQKQTKKKLDLHIFHIMLHSVWICFDCCCHGPGLWNDLVKPQLFRCSLWKSAGLNFISYIARCMRNIAHMKPFHSIYLCVGVDCCRARQGGPTAHMMEGKYSSCGCGVDPTHITSLRFMWSASKPTGLYKDHVFDLLHVAFSSGNIIS